MEVQSSRSVRTRDSLVVTGLLAVLGTIVFWLWRRNAPLARYLRRHNRQRQEPNPERNSGTDPI